MTASLVNFKLFNINDVLSNISIVPLGYAALANVFLPDKSEMSIIGFLPELPLILFLILILIVLH